MKRELERFARSLGFSNVYAMRPERFERWGDFVLAHPEYKPRRPKDDPRLTMPECRSVLLLVWPYQPFELEPSLAAPSAYYLASNASHLAAERVVSFLEERGHRATDDTNIPEKALAERVGAGKYGRNGIIAAPEHGSRIALQSILTDAQIEPDALEDGHEYSDECQNCDACMAACPVGALRGDGRVDVSRCLRAQSMGQPFPVEWRHLIEGSLIGCDLCQDCCPRNRAVSRIPVPQRLLTDMSLPKLLAGEVDGARDWIGANYARKQRMQARACMVAANLGRTDCLPQILALCEDEAELVRDAAEWARAQLTKQDMGNHL